MLIDPDEETVTIYYRSPTTARRQETGDRRQKGIIPLTLLGMVEFMFGRE